MAKKRIKKSLDPVAFTGKGSSARLVAEPNVYDPANLSVEDFMVSRSYVVNVENKSKYPISKADYKKLKLQASRPTRSAGLAFIDAAPDADDEILLPGIDLPEDGMGAAGPMPLAPAIAASFTGLGATAFQPPDCTVAVGKQDVVVGVNVEMAGYKKTGALRFRWPGFTTLFRAVTPNGAQLFDPKLIYDHYADRYVAVVAARTPNQGSWLMVGATQTNDPGGRWWVYALNASVDGSTATANWADYPMVGFDEKGIYISTNQFKWTGGFSHAKLRTLIKAELYAGAPVHWYDFWGLTNNDGSQAFSVQPCCHFRAAGNNTPVYMVSAIWPSASNLTQWNLTNATLWLSGSTPSLSRSKVPCRKYELPPDADQPSTTNNIETNDTRLLNAIYQHAGNKRSIWTCQTSKHTWAGESTARSVVQWYEINASTKTVVQQNAYGAKGRYYYFPVIQTDSLGNAFLVFTRSGSTELPCLRATGRKTSMPANDLEGSLLVKAGESAYNGSRWGDYFGICRDGADPRTVWGYGEYAEAGGNWGTWIVAMRY